MRFQGALFGLLLVLSTPALAIIPSYKNVFQCESGATLVYNDDFTKFDYGVRIHPYLVKFDTPVGERKGDFGVYLQDDLKSVNKLTVADRPKEVDAPTVFVWETEDVRWFSRNSALAGLPRNELYEKLMEQKPDSSKTYRIACWNPVLTTVINGSGYLRLKDMPAPNIFINLGLYTEGERKERDARGWFRRELFGNQESRAFYYELGQRRIELLEERRPVTLFNPLTKQFVRRSLRQLVQHAEPIACNYFGRMSPISADTIAPLTEKNLTEAVCVNPKWPTRPGLIVKKQDGFTITRQVDEVGNEVEGTTRYLAVQDYKEDWADHARPRFVFGSLAQALSKDKGPAKLKGAEALSLTKEIFTIEMDWDNTMACFRKTY
jgi:hypothetical protein